MDQSAPSKISRGSLQHWKRKLSSVFDDCREKIGMQGLATCISNALRKEDKQFVVETLGSNVDALKANVADALAEASAGQPALEAAVAHAAQTVIGGRNKSASLLRVPGKRVWARVKKHIPKQKRGRKSKIHSDNIRQQVRIFLLENSTETCKLMKHGDAVVKVHNLKRSRHKLWACSREMRQLMCKSIWYEHLSKYHQMFVRLKCRTDVCTFCHKYDRTVLPQLRRQLEACKKKILELEPEYFLRLNTQWAELVQAGRADPDGELSLQYVSMLVEFIDKCAAARTKVRIAPGTVKKRQDLKEAEAAASHALKGDMQLLRSCANHFATVKRQNQQREALEDCLPQSCLLVQLDFMQNMSWPLGPEEAQDWWWATARESMTTLGFYCHFWSGETERREYHHYISQIMNHDSAFAIVCLNDLLAKLPLTEDHTELIVWADCGPHFRSYDPCSFRNLFWILEKRLLLQGY